MKRITEVLIDQWLYDIEVLSQGWVLWTIVPALFYAVFMLIKWIVLTCPVWMPLALVVQSFRSK